jgi:hypothetical protein
MGEGISNTKVLAAVTQLNELLREPGYTPMFCGAVAKSLQKLN